MKRKKIRRNSESFEGGTVLTMKDGGIDRFRLVSIKQGLKARKIGMFITRGATTAKLMAMLGEYTGVKYKRTDLDKAIADAQRLLDADVNLKMQRDLAKGLSDNRGLRRNSARSADMTVANELFLFIQNDEILLMRRYPQYVQNLERKIKRGVYNREKAVKLFMYLADEASKKYSKQFGDGKTHTADVPTRMALAKMLLEKFEEDRKAMTRMTADEQARAMGIAPSRGVWKPLRKNSMINPDLSISERDQDSRSKDFSPLKKLVMDLASDFAPVVKDIEGSRYSTTQNNYGRYMSLINSMSKGDKKRAEIIAMALITAGANRSGVKSALRVMFGE